VVSRRSLRVKHRDTHIKLEVRREAALKMLAAVAAGRPGVNQDEMVHTTVVDWLRR
jgi:hypothetical protein